MSEERRDEPRRRGACHCGAVRFEVVLDGGLDSRRRCDCSFCRMRGAVAVSARLEDLTITAGEETLTEYRFNTGTARHWFCSVCGIYTHHRRRSDPSQYGINVACLEGLGPFDFDAVEVTDGVHHPSDPESAGRPHRVGVLRFERDA